MMMVSIHRGKFLLPSITTCWFIPFHLLCIRSDEESDDEDDDEEELQAELQRIKAEREQAQARKMQEDMELEQRMKSDSAMKGNPLAMIEENSSKV